MDGRQADHDANGGVNELKTAFFSKAVFREMSSYQFLGHRTGRDAAEKLLVQPQD